MGMTIRAVIFDMGGVILRTEDQSGRRKWEQRFGMRPGELPELVFGCPPARAATIGDEPERAIWEYVARTLELDDAQLAEFQRDFWSGDRVDKGLVQFLHGLRPQVKVGILSNAWDGARAAITGKYGLGDLADVMVFSAEERMAKPDPRIFRLSTERLGVRPEEAIFVDDVLENVQAARAVGLRGVQFKNTAQTIAEIHHIFDQSPDS